MNLLNLASITTEISTTVTQGVRFNGSPRNLMVQANFSYGSGGTSVDAYVQTSLDGGNTWTDIVQFHFTTASSREAYNLSAASPETTAVALTDGSMSANSAQDGLLGRMFRVKYTSSGTYAATSMSIDVSSIDITN